MQWDFWTLRPESAHQVTFLMTDRGTPYSWRHMNGYGSHTFMWINAAGEKFWVKYHFKTDQGIKNFTDAEAAEQTALDRDYHVRDLSQAIDAGEHPSWTVQVQVMPFEDAAGYRFNPFDLTKVWPHADYPPITIGRFVLNRNPDDYFTQIEQAAFELLPTWCRASRRAPTRCSRASCSPTRTPTATGSARTTCSCRSTGRRCPSTPTARTAPCGTRTTATRCTRRTPCGGPQADPSLYEHESYSVTGELVRAAYTLHAEDDDYGQPRALYENVLSDTDRANLASNIVGHASRPEVTAEMKARVVEYWRNVAKPLGDDVAKGLGVNGR